VNIRFFFLFYFLFLTQSCESNKIVNEEIRIVLIGEWHNYFEKFSQQLSLIKEINEEKHIEHIIFEQPHTTGIRINHFFSTGDSLSLKAFLKSESELVNRDYSPLYNFYLNLYDYAQSFPKEEQFELHFIDAESYKTHNILTWIELLKQTDNQKLINRLEKIDFDINDFVSTIETIEELDFICSREDLIKEHIYYEDLLKIREGFLVTNRDSLMCQRVLKLLEADKNSLIMGQFGDWHICRANESSLVNLLAESSDLVSTNQIMTIHLNFNPKKEGVVSKKNCDYDLVVDVFSKDGRFLR
jgi:hypothetical protein